MRVGIGSTSRAGRLRSIRPRDGLIRGNWYRRTSAAHPDASVPALFRDGACAREQALY